MVESVYGHNKNWHFIRWPHDTFGPCARCLPWLFSKSQGSSRGGTYALIWIREPTKNMYHFHRLDEIKALCYTSQDYTHTESWNTSFCPAFSPSAPCILWGKGKRFHGDVTSDLDPYAYRGSGTWPLCVWVWGLWMYRCLRNKGGGGLSSPADGNHQAGFTEQHGALTSGLQQRCRQTMSDQARAELSIRNHPSRPVSGNLFHSPVHIGTHKKQKEQKPTLFSADSWPCWRKQAQLGWKGLLAGHAWPPLRGFI